MGVCSKRNFLLTICTLQLITTVERQVFDFLGFMWMPILVNFFNIIFVILGFFGAYQYRPKYIISYSTWNVLWLGWNVFVICFYLDVGVLDKTSDLLNLGTGSFSWWHVNGPGCRAYNNGSTMLDLYRPTRPDRVEGCVLEYDVVEVLHAATQCLLAVMAVISGICLSRLFLEEADDSFDFIGGDDFGTAGQTPLHPMYVSYSALPPANKHLTAGNDNYYYTTNTATTTSIGSHRSTSSLITPLPSSATNLEAKKAFQASLQQQLQQQQQHQLSNRARAMIRNAENASLHSAGSNNSSFRRNDDIRPQAAVAAAVNSIEYADYSNPIDHLPESRNNRIDYDTLETHTPNLSSNRHRYRQVPPPPVTYSPLMRSRQFARNSANSGSGGRSRNSYNRPRVHADHIRLEQQQLPPPLPPPQRLRSAHSDPRLAMLDELREMNDNPRGNDDLRSRRDGRPLSMFVNNY